MLRITGQRNDGYHLLQTYFQLLNWGDIMLFESTQNNTIEIHGEFGSLTTEHNLIYKAAKLLLPYKNTNHGVKIDVEKNIPQGSGLGGGSSNAGTTLRVLNRLWKCNLSNNDLQKLAVTLGADVPVFVLNQSAMATGVGEKLTPYCIEEFYFVLIFPKISISTIKVFSDSSLLRNQEPIDINGINNKKNWTNTCLQPVLSNYPMVKNIYTKASKLTNTYMSGTGSTLFTCFNNQDKALEFCQKCPAEWKTTVCRSK